MTRVHSVRLKQSWEEMPAVRRHLYFYMLLILATIVAGSLRDSSGPVSKIAPGPTNPPPITAKEVYPAPVSL